MSRLSCALSAAVSCAAILAAQPALAQDATPLQEITVEGAAGVGSGTGGAPGVATNDGYVAKTTRTATKTETPVNEAPVTINTVTQQQLQDRLPQTLADALAYTPGVRVGAYGFDDRFDSFTIRGVDVTYTGVFRDGLRQFNSPSGLFRLEPYGLESISILKGPASSIYGASSSVGIIDLISKRPTDYKFAEIELQGGSWDRKQFNFDLGGPLNEEGTVLFRLTGVGRDANTNLPGVPDDRLFIAPAVTFQPTEDTKLTILSEFMASTLGGSTAYNNTYAPYVLKDGTVTQQPTGAIKEILFNPDYNQFTQQQGRVGYEFEHRFNDAVSVHQNVRWSGLSTNERFGDASGTYVGQVKEKVSAFAADTYLKTQIATGPVGHTILTGVDFGHLNYDSRIGYNFAAAEDPDLPDPTKQKQRLVGVYVQEELKAGPWRLLLSGRHDWMDSTYRVPGAASAKQNEGAFTGRAGLSYVTDFGVTPFVSYGTSFNPNSGTVIDPDGAGPLTGGVAKPTKGEAAEAGVKYAVPGYNANINASVFWLKQRDGIVYTVVDSINRQTQLDFRSRGFEVEATASLANGINLLASYSYTDTKILKLSPDTVGNEVNSVPKHAFSMWAGYEVKQGAAKGLGLGAGVRYTGSSFGDDYNRAVIKNKPRAFVDAMLSYDFEAIDPKLKGVRAQLNATNLLDKVEQVCTASYCYFNQGRKVIASLRYRW